jgi:hypothetical protein
MENTAAAQFHALRSTPSRCSKNARANTLVLGIIPDNANKIGAKYRYWPTTTSVYTTLQTPISL